MGFKGNVGFLRLVRTLGAPSHRNFLDRSSGSLWGLHGRLNFLRRESIGIYISAEGATTTSLFGSSSSLQRKPKERDFTNSKGGKQVKNSIELAKYL
jgi:hypothetical protein